MFFRTFHTIDSETDGRSPWLLVTFGVLATAWLYWFTCVPISVYETSASARVEVASASFPVDAPVTGAVVATPNLVLGKRVAEGDVIVELESESLRLALAEASAREAALAPQLAAVARELQAEASGLAGEGSRGVLAIEEARSRRREAAVSAELAASEAERQRILFEGGAVSAQDNARTAAEAERRKAAAAAVSAEVRKLGSQSSTNKSDRKTRIATLERAEATLRGDLAVQQAKVASLENDMKQRRIRAPAAGVVSAIGRVRVGSVLKQGDPVATIIAGDGLRLVAELPPAAVFGRIRSGQTARVRFDGFPWVEYGVPHATVTQVAGEVRDGKARVELALDAASAARIPLQHGQPAEVMIAVDRTTPWHLLLRAVGRGVANERPTDGKPAQ